MSSLKTLKTFAKYRGNHETFKPKYLNISYILCIYFYIYQLFQGYLALLFIAFR